jgi:hypothetical protein
MLTVINLKERFFEQWYGFRNTTFFVMISMLYLILMLLKRMFIIADVAAFEILQERGDMWLFDLFFGFQYLSIPIWLAWKFSLTAFVLWVGCFMFGYKITYHQLWRWVMFSELIFLLPELIKLLWFLMIPQDPSYQDIVAFYPLSILSLFNYQEVHESMHYPLKALNVFELIYWLMLMTGVFFLSGKKWNSSVYIVLSSYVLFLFFWLIFYLLVYK